MRDPCTVRVAQTERRVGRRLVGNHCPVHTQLTATHQSDGSPCLDLLPVGNHATQGIAVLVRHSDGVRKVVGR